jgi:anaerobic selenocysteine-containing dehydrogenase
MAAVCGGERKKIATYCYQCVNGPDMFTVEVIDGVATKVEPNFAVSGLHPADGKVCVKPYGLIQKEYSPHRILKPMKRTNPKKGRGEDPGWVEITWEEALDTVAAKLRAIRPELLDENGNPKLAFTTGGSRDAIVLYGGVSRPVRRLGRSHRPQPGRRRHGQVLSRRAFLRRIMASGVYRPARHAAVQLRGFLR